jgi:hypothetical protein
MTHDPPIAAPSLRTFSLNSREFYEAVREPIEPPWIMAGSLPREPRGRDRPVIDGVEWREE